jgi:multiple sugar transport system substrate-binding protein
MATLPKKLLATLAAAGLTTGLVACSSDDDGSGGDINTDHGPITFAMGKNDTNKLTPIIEAWNKDHPDEKVTLKELAGEEGDQRDTLVKSLQAGSDEYDVMALDVTVSCSTATPTRSRTPRRSGMTSSRPARPSSRRTRTA